MNKLVSIFLIACLIVSMVSCGSEDPPAETPPSSYLDQTQTAQPIMLPVEEEEIEGKILIFTLAVDEYLEESYYIKTLVDRYHDRIIHLNYPYEWWWEHNANKNIWVEDAWSLIEAEISDAQIKSFIVYFPLEDPSDIKKRIKEYRPDILFIDLF